MGNLKKVEWVDVGNDCPIKITTYEDESIIVPSPEERARKWEKLHDFRTEQLKKVHDNLATAKRLLREVYDKPYIIMTAGTLWHDAALKFLADGMGEKE